MLENYRVLRFRWKYYVITQIIIGIVVCVGENFWLRNGINICVTDGVGLLMNGALFLILYIVNLFYIVNVINSRNDVQIILRHGSRKRVWVEDIRQNFIINCLTSVLWCVDGLVSGATHSRVFHNWNDFNSFFSREITNTGKGVCKLNVIFVLLISVSEIMLLLDVISLFIYVSVLITDNVHIGLAIILGTGFLDTWIIKEPFFIKRFLVYSDVWLVTGNIIKNMFLLTVILAAIILIGFIVIGGKEFYDNERNG
jgi:hypothetical protein